MEKAYNLHVFLEDVIFAKWALFQNDRIGSECKRKKLIFFSRCYINGCEDTIWSVGITIQSFFVNREGS